MEDDNTKDEPNEPNETTTSKKASQSNNSVEDNNSKDDQKTNSEMTESDTYSVLSDVDMASTKLKLPKGVTLKTDRKSPVKKKRTKRLAGRIKKRERLPVKRQRKPLKRKPRAREEKKERSVSTIFTRLSSGVQTPACQRCGHRCCLRRHEYESRKKYSRNNRERIRKCKRILKRNKGSKKEYIIKNSEGNQAGSRSKMLSPLFISINSSPGDNLQQPAKSYCEINPEMIYEALRSLTLWKQNVPTNSILEYIIKKYPVNNERTELMIELLEKLTIAAIVGIISRSSADTWSVSHAFQNRRLTTNHVTLFWKMYADTLKPIAKKEVKNIHEQDKLDNKTATNVNTLVIHDEDII